MLHLDRLLALPSNIRIGWKGFWITNAVAYYKNSHFTDKKVLYHWPQVPVREHPKVSSMMDRERGEGIFSSQGSMLQTIFYNLQFLCSKLECFSQEKSSHILTRSMFQSIFCNLQFLFSKLECFSQVKSTYSQGQCFKAFSVIYNFFAVSWSFFTSKKHPSLILARSFL